MDIKYKKGEIKELYKRLKCNGYREIEIDSLERDINNGTYNSILRIPYEDLPLYINEYEIRYKELVEVGDSTFNIIVKWRLSIGR